MRRRGGMRDRWRAAVVTSTDIDGETRAMLVVLLDWMSDTGRVTVPRDRLADLFAVDPRRITERIKRARDAGLLDKVGGGYRGRTAIYDAVIPSRKVAGLQPPFSEKGGGLDTPLFPPPFSPHEWDRPDRKGGEGDCTQRARVTHVTHKQVTTAAPLAANHTGRTERNALREERAR